MRYLDAQDKVKKEETGKRKRAGNLNNRQKGEKDKGAKEKTSGLRSEQKNIKQVRFSNDFM